MSFVVSLALGLTPLVLDASQPRDFSAIVRSSPRPEVCVSTGGRRRGARLTLWERARDPRLARFCDELARGYSRLSRDPESAVKAANRADRALKGQAAPLVLRARAHLLLSKTTLALKDFERARKLDPRSVESPEALHDLALVAAQAERGKLALETYRILVPRASLLGSGRRRQNVFLEAALSAQTLGAAGIDEAIGYLNEARRMGNLPGFRAYVQAALALALDRGGRIEEAQAIREQALGVEALERRLNRARPLPVHREPRVTAAELHVLIAFSQESADPKSARTHYREFIRLAPKSPWLGHAKQRLAKLGGR